MSRSRSEKWVKKIQAAANNGARTVSYEKIDIPMWLKKAPA